MSAPSLPTCPNGGSCSTCGGIAYCTARTEQQEALAAQALALLALLDETVPTSVVHWAVEDARRALVRLARAAQAPNVLTRDAL